MGLGFRNIVNLLSSGNGTKFLSDDGTYKEISTSSSYPTVNTFADLPAAADHTDEIYVVKQGSGLYMINRKSAGLYLSNGVSWNRLGNIPAYFNDTNFEVYNNADNTKGVKFDVSGVATGTIRTLTIPNENGDVFYTTARKNDAHKEIIAFALSDETSDLEAATGAGEFQMPFAGTLLDVIATVTTAPTGSTLIVDCNKNASSILSTKLSIDASEKTSETAATPVVISDTALATGDIISFDIDQVGLTIKGTGLKVYMIITRA